MYCRSCGVTKTTEWRRGPDGCKSLCNACGLHFSKILKKERMSEPQSLTQVVKVDLLLNPTSQNLVQPEDMTFDNGGDDESSEEKPEEDIVNITNCTTDSTLKKDDSTD
eukprot:TRINITY_DN2769_c0_g1_i2.p1 TRINITY_DN2769_c0_g1~~TRINITY_DN2769_c0_g1_i2.p1  ORF type:complete len:109 (-),score=18.86 TRINITY_DN2769_c0_g1_i2:19-345(-)